MAGDLTGPPSDPRHCLGSSPPRAVGLQRMAPGPGPHVPRPPRRRVARSSLASIGALKGWCQRCRMSGGGDALARRLRPTSYRPEPTSQPTSSRSDRHPRWTPTAVQPNCCFPGESLGWHVKNWLANRISKVGRFRRAAAACVNAVGSAGSQARGTDGDAMAEWDAAGLRWTQRDWFPRPWRADLGHSEFTDAGRTECGFQTAGNGEIAGQWLFRWTGMGSL
jgi:hypothetical protein